MEKGRQSEIERERHTHTLTQEVRELEKGRQSEIERETHTHTHSGGQRIGERETE